MLIIILLILFTPSTSLDHRENVGSVLFYKRFTNECWNQGDVARLRARKVFENVLPPPLSPDKINDNISKQILRYFQKAFRQIPDIPNFSQAILKEALADAIGGYLRKDFLPNARLAYYAGYVSYRSVRDMEDFYESMKLLLNTQGLGWTRPERIPLQNFTVKKILIGSGKPFDPCKSLIVQRVNKDCIVIPMPSVDDEEAPSAMALPFEYGGLVNLMSPNSEDAFLKYYTTAARCILRRSPEGCRHKDFVKFNSELWYWMKKYVAPLLMDEKLYTAFNGVLRVAAAVQRYGKEFGRHNMPIDNQDKQSESISSNLFDNEEHVNWGPLILCMEVSLGSMILIYCFYLIYTFTCCCKRDYCYEDIESMYKDEKGAYSKAASIFPVLLPHKHDKYRTTTSRTSSQDSLALSDTQKVFGYNETREKVVSVATNKKNMKGPSSPEGSASYISQANEYKRGHSPPKIKVKVDQLKIEKTPQRKLQTRKASAYSMSLTKTLSGKLTTESPWSDSYTTDCSVTTGSIRAVSNAKSHLRPDLGWRRNVQQERCSPGVSDTALTTPVTVCSYRQNMTDHGQQR